jgi:predicted RNase H-like nuclease
MSVVLGIDAAWTAGNPSGVALAEKRGASWRLIALSPSYDRFHARANGLAVQGRVIAGSHPDPKALLESSANLSGRRVDLVAVDMPLALTPITARRKSDNAVSIAYGARKCGTHTPNRDRPGLISEALRIGFEREGYALQTGSISPRGLIEVYPHPALVELDRASERLPYKVSRVRQYWPSSSAEQRRSLLLREWARIFRLLEERIEGVSQHLPPISEKPSLQELKSYEDMLDAVVCAWVAICALEGRARPYGDAESAIWIPNGAN